MTTAAHGTLRRYIVDGCRCDPCRVYRVRYQKQYLHDVNSGRPRTIPVQVVQDHLAMLIESGMSQWAITKAAGYTSRNAIYRFLSGETHTRVNLTTARRILAVTPDSDTRPTAPRPIAPSRDRLHRHQWVWCVWTAIAGSDSPDGPQPGDVLTGRATVGGAPITDHLRRHEGGGCMTARHPGHVWRDDSAGYPTYIATCPRCDWEAKPTVLMGLAHQWLRDHQDQQQRQQQQQQQQGEQG